MTFDQRQILEARKLRRRLRRRGRLQYRHNLSKDLRNHFGDIGKQSSLREIKELVISKSSPTRQPFF
ncbi:hypothetical protein L5515_015539 [Caenorhabditis briggsae]|uniref:Uncharacterized protein n=1 Tax=Caenorhabditis briggsae TaxID=6238 RepID=A0AAE9J9E8_CAEBR|nr:hypothetical protein L5515_015539 [Caenorhabditis briggsae]